MLNPKVTVCCPQCDAAKEIDFDLIWKKGRGTNSFIDLICRNKFCIQQKTVSLGKWLRYSQDAASNISAWCKAHGVRQGTAKHMRLTVDMFMEREDVHDVNAPRKEKL